eukprot:12180-Chlamydomonas_euryale.AAC.1
MLAQSRLQSSTGTYSSLQQHSGILPQTSSAALRWKPVPCSEGLTERWSGRHLGLARDMCNHSLPSVSASASASARQWVWVWEWAHQWAWAWARQWARVWARQWA